RSVRDDPHRDRGGRIGVDDVGGGRPAGESRVPFEPTARRGATPLRPGRFIGDREDPTLRPVGARQRRPDPPPRQATQRPNPWIARTGFACPLENPLRGCNHPPRPSSFLKIFAYVFGELNALASVA